MLPWREKRCRMSAVALASSSKTTTMPSSTTSTVVPDDDQPEGSYSRLVHQSADHCRSTLTAISRMRQNKQLCDVSLCAGSEEIPAHRLVLAAASPYFHAMFNGDMAEKASNEVTLHDIDPLALQQLIEYVYTGEIVITEENVQVLLPASSLLQVTAVKDACCRFLHKQLHPSNCLGIRSFADAHACRELERVSHRFAVRNFQDVMTTEEFLLLPFEDVEELVSSPELNVAAEEQVLAAALGWLKHDPAERERYVAPLLSHVRLPLLPRDVLMQHVEAEPLVHRSEPARDLLLEAMKFHLLPEQRPQLASPRTLARRPEGLQQMLVAVGGGSLFAIHCECEAYLPNVNRWQPIAPMAVRRSRAGVAGLERSLFAVGGYDGSSDLATAEMYSSHLNTWSVITPMGTKRSCLGVCAFGGLVYACGGYDGASCLNSTERLDPLTGCWTSCPAMLQRRRYCRVAVLDNCVYALGGFDSTSYQASAERLDPRTGCWEILPAMSCRRSSSGAAALNGALYCIGGTDGTTCMSSGERFNTRRHAWEPIAAMQSRRSTHEIVALGGTIVALGGNDGNSSLNSCERYDPITNRWALLTAMGNRRSSVGAAVLDCLGSC